MTGRRRAAVAALAAGAVLAAPSAASAEPLKLLGLGSAKSSTTNNPLGAVFGLLGGQNGLGGVVQSVLCPPLNLVNGAVGGLNDLTGRNPLTSGVHQLTSGVTNLACNAGILDYRFQTTWRRSNGTEVTRTVVAQLGVPKPLNVDDDAAADLIGTITITGPNTVGLIVERAPGESSTLPTQVEAIIGNPSGTLLSGQLLNLGYDSRTDRAPGRFEVSTPMDAFLRSNPVYDVRVKQQDTGQTLNLLAGTFKGNPTSRQDVTSLRLAYGRSPVNAQIRAETGGTTKLRATTDRPGSPLTATVRSSSFDADLELAKFPNNVDLSLNSSNASVTYDGHGSSIERITADVRPRNGAIAGVGRVKAVLDGLQNAGRLAVEQPNDGVKVTAEPEIGLVDLRTSELGGALPEPPNADGNGVRADVTGDQPRIAARIARLRSVEVGTSPIGLKLATGAAAPFVIDAKLEGQGGQPATVQGSINDLPETFELGLADEGIRFKGSAPVDRIDLDATNLDIADGADRLKARLDRLPAEGTLAFGEGQDGLEVKTTGGGIGRVELQAGSGDALPVAPGEEEENGALVDTTGNGLKLGVRLHDLQEIAVKLDPIALTTKMGSSRPFRIQAALAGDAPEGSTEPAPTSTVNALIKNLPEQFQLGLADGGLTYAGSSAVELLELDATNLPIAEGTDRIKARLDRLPAEGSLSFGEGEDGLEVKTTGGGIGRVELQAGSGDALPVAPGEEEENGALVDGTGEGLKLGVRLHDLQEIAVKLDPIALTTKMGSARPFRIQAALPGEAEEGATEPAPNTTVDALIKDLPQEFRLGLGEGGLTYGGSAPVELLEINATNLPIGNGADRLRARLDRLPAEGELGFGGSSDGLSVVAGGGGIGRVEIQAGSSTGDLPVAPGEEGDNSALVDLAGGTLKLGVRLHDLKEITVNPAPLALRTRTGSTRPLLINAQLPGEAEEGSTEPAAPIKVNAEIRDLPEEFDLGLEDLADGGAKLGYKASAPVESLSLKGEGIAFLEGSAGIEAAIRRVPKEFALNLPTAAPGTPLATLTVPEGEQPIGELRLAAGLPIPATGLNPDGSGDQAVKDELRYTDEGVALRLSGLRGLSMTADPLDLSLTQDPAATKPVDIVASIPNGEGQPPATVNGQLTRTTASTRIQALVADGEPARLKFTNAGNLGRLALQAQNLGDLGNLNLSLDNLAPKLNVCVDSGPKCRRPNPNVLSGGAGGGDGRPYPALFSVDFDDEGTQQSGQTTFNASLPLDGQTVAVENVRFSNLGFDIGQGPTFSGVITVGQQVPRLYLFMDSRSKPFVINDIRVPGQIEHFRVGTDGSQATGNNRIAWLKGTKNAGFLFDQASAGTLNCGGRREISVKLGPFSANILNAFGGQIVPLCN
ncbi:hypothetical protein SK069_03320 [Patulibacter brassicae]|uniref:DUF320 domain-containing protein n=1 Tax=Patulibacter brassicae TaxID=1705717 RepID=A0ABU4VFL4_9ACTN|nr:hypothetical protein [Patulibacter brassicae]MDX8150612.1 hypothetical protein [Patulibacter brassicae]